jgi:hypothetical protein
MCPRAVGAELIGSHERRDGASLIPQSKYLRCAGALTVSVMLAVSAMPASAKSRGRHAPRPQAAVPVSKEPFGNVPKGPIQIFVSIDQQKLHLYSDGVHVADTSVATGVPSLPTPLGVFSVIQKQVFHRSNLYSNAPMPFMQRITWSGVALHEGESIGHRASHGCIRMPRDFAMRLYGLTRTGARVIVADQELKPSEFADPHLFVHKDKPPEPAPAPVASDAPKIAENADISKTTDAAPADAAAPLQPTALGLRVSTAAAVATPVSATSDTAALPPPGKPVDIAKAAPVKKTPIAIFISRKEKKIFVRQDFEPLFDAAVTIEQPDRPLGTHVFTAMDLLDDHAAFRWTVVSLPGDPPKPVRNAENEKRSAKHPRDGRHDDDSAKTLDIPPPPQTPAEALARIAIPQDAIDRISALMVPGSSLIVSDQGIGDETGEGTDFIVVTR